MIIEEVLLHNVGVFRGEQRAVLSPPSSKRPVVLFGGLNGAGKTTLLESLQLVLYGKQSVSGRRTELGYEEYLRRLIHRDVPARDGAAVQIQLQVNEDGETHRLRVRRTWSETGSRISERLDVFRDGIPDEHLTETWAEYVGRLIPPQLSQVFFFDGERIEALADPEQSMEILRSAIHALLGVDLVQQLQDDLLVLKRRKLTERQSGPEKARMEELENSIRRLKNELALRKQTEAELQTKHDRAEEILRRAEATFVHEGGELAENRKLIEARQLDLKRRAQEVEAELRALAGEALPLALIKPLLEKTQMQATAEVDAGRAATLRSLAEERDARLLHALSRKLNEQSILKKIAAVFESDRRKHLTKVLTQEYLHLDENDRAQLTFLTGPQLAEECSRAQTQLGLLDELGRSIDETDMRLAAIPDPDAIAKLGREREEAQRNLQMLKDAISKVGTDTQQTRDALRVAEEAWTRLAEHAQTAELENEDADRSIRHVDRARETLDQFRVALTKRHANRLEEMVFDGFKRLLRKQRLVQGVQIDPDTCRLLLSGENGKELTPERLSAGERQLLAVSVLWGLAQASGRPLPVIVDTPLGRLDRAHRMHLVKHYFPVASHQVILLSTDEEITGEYLAALKPRIGRCYRFAYDDKSSSSVIEEGYFSEEMVAC